MFNMLNNTNDPYQLLDEFEGDDDPRDLWPHADISVNMLVQATPGHSDYHIRVGQTGLVTKQIDEQFEVLWSDGSTELNTSYRLERAHDRARLSRTLEQEAISPLERNIIEDWSPPLKESSGSTQSSSGIGTNFYPGDLVMTRHWACDEELNGTGLVVEVDDYTSPPNIYVIWPSSGVWMYEDDLVHYEK